MRAKLSRIWNSRELRKLRRDKGALIALAVIGVYFLVGLAVMGEVITRRDYMGVVGPNSKPGFFVEESRERRFELARNSMLKPIRRALGRPDPKAALADVKLGRWRPAEKSIEELEAIVADASTIEKLLNQSVNLDEDPPLEPQLVAFEKKTAELIEPLSGWDRWMQSAALLLGTDAQGRSIFFRGIYSIKVALQIGVVTAVISVLLGAVLGAAAGYWGGWVDSVIVWLYTTFSSIPNLVLLVVVAYAFTDSDAKDTLLPVYIAFCATFWIGTCRVIRGETLKLKQQEYIQAAQTAGFGSMRILLRHVLPNTSHLMLINFSLLLIGAIKSEVILSFLGLGVKSQPSWGVMIRDAGSNGDVMTGFFWQIGTATVLMFVLVLAFNILSDALQDAFDPKHL